MYVYVILSNFSQSIIIITKTVHVFYLHVQFVLSFVYIGPEEPHCEVVNCVYISSVIPQS